MERWLIILLILISVYILMDFYHKYLKYKSKYLGGEKKVNAICVLSNGIVRFKEQDNNTVLIEGEIKGLTPGDHGFHIHETGDLTEGCDSCCAHYNPYNKNHGGRDLYERHVGDLGNITADSDGNAIFSFEDSLIKLRGPISIIGRSVVVHADPDDLGKGGNEASLTTGNSGKRIACGVIGYAKSC